MLKFKFKGNMPLHKDDLDTVEPHICKCFTS